MGNNDIGLLTMTIDPHPDERYLIALGAGWIKHRVLTQNGDFNQDVNYYIERLPGNYGVFETSHRGQRGGGQIYKRLFGHPSGRFYDSTVRFMPHFIWLMSEMQGDCDCVLCHRRTDSGPVKRRNVFDRSLLAPDRTSLPSRLPRTHHKRD